MVPRNFPAEDPGFSAGIHVYGLPATNPLQFRPFSAYPAEKRPFLTFLGLFWGPIFGARPSSGPQSTGLISPTHQDTGTTNWTRFRPRYRCFHSWPQNSHGCFHLFPGHFPAEEPRVFDSITRVQTPRKSSPQIPPIFGLPGRKTAFFDLFGPFWAQLLGPGTPRGTNQLA